MAVGDYEVAAVFEGKPISITASVDTFDFQRGRSYEFDQIEPGVLNLVLDNPDGEFTPGKLTTVDSSAAVTNYVSKPRANQVPSGGAAATYGYSASASTNSTPGAAALSASWFPLTATVTTAGTVASVSALLTTTRIPVTAGQAFSFGGLFNLSGAATELRFDFSFYNSSGTLLGTSSTSALTVANGALVTGMFAPVALTSVVSASLTTTASVEVSVRATAPSTAAAGASFGVRMDRLFAYPGTYNSYFDGGSSGCSWAGAVANSLSTKPAGFSVNRFSGLIVPGVTIAMYRYDSSLALVPSFVGYAEKWPVEVGLGNSKVRVPVVDKMSRLAQAKLEPPFTQLMREHDSNMVYLPLRELYGASVAADWGFGYTGNRVRTTGVGTATFGSPAVVTEYDGSEGRSFEVTNVDSATNSGACLEIDCTNSKTGLPPLVSFVNGMHGFVAFEYRAFTGSGAGTVYTIWNTANRALFALTLDTTTPTINLSWGDGNASPTSTTVTAPSFGPSGQGFNSGSFNQGDKFLVYWQITPVTASTFNVIIDVYYYNSARVKWYNWYGYFGTYSGGAWQNVSIGKIQLGTPVDTTVSGFIKGRYQHFLANWKDQNDPSAINPQPLNTLWMYYWFIDRKLPDDVTALYFLCSTTKLDYSLFAANMPTAARAIPNWGADANPLDAAQQILNNTFGYFFATRTGTFKALTLSQVQGGASKVTFDCNSSTAIEAGLSFDYDIDRIINDVTVSGGSVQSAFEVKQIATVSQAAYTVKSEQIATTLLTPAEGTSLARSRLSLRAQPSLRVTGIRVNLTTLPAATADSVAALEIGDRITVTNLPSMAPYTSADFIIEGISWEAESPGERSDVSVSFFVSPLLGFFVLDSSTLGGTATLGL